jgi:ubiquinone biosynthesis protein
MDLIKTGIGLGKTIRNVSRLKEIVLVFAKHGFDEFISLGVTTKIPNFVLPKSKRSIKQELKDKEELDWSKILGHRLRLCFEELGPAFIKFGQLLSSREDIFEASFIEEMRILRDKVKPIPFKDVRPLVERSLGKPIDQVFSSIDENPIGTASIGVVYKGTLLSGEKVVLKVRRPGIEKMMETDFSILSFLAAQAEKASEEVKYLGVSRVVNDFSLSLVNELNFNIEELNIQRFNKVLEKYNSNNTFYVPKTFPELSHVDLLVMECLEGTPFSDHVNIEQYLDDLGPKLEEGLVVFIKTFLREGFFHADLHGGNFFYLINGQIGLIDFGLMGSLSKKGRKSFVAIIYAMLTFNYENLVYEFLDVAEYENIPDVDDLVNDVRDTLSPYIGLTVQQTDFSAMLKSVIFSLKKHQIFLPREWFLVFRGLMTLDGVGRSLGQDYDLFSLMEDDIQEIIKTNFNKDEMMEDAVWALRDLSSLGRVIPRHLKWYLKDWSKKGYGHKLVITGHEVPLNNINNAVIFLGFITLTCIFVISGVDFIEDKEISGLSQVPTISWFFWGLGFIAFIRGSWQIRKSS